MINFPLSLQVLLSVKLFAEAKSHLNNYHISNRNFGKERFQKNNDNKSINLWDYKVNPIKLDNEFNYFLGGPNKLKDNLSKDSIKSYLTKERIDISDKEVSKKLKYRGNSLKMDNQINLKASESNRLHGGYNIKNKTNNDLIIFFIAKQDNSLRRKWTCFKVNKYRDMGTCDRRLLKTCKNACKKAHQNVCSYYKCSHGMKMKFISKCNSNCKRFYKKAFRGYAKYS